jgi:hypothetical protein
MDFVENLYSGFYTENYRGNLLLFFTHSDKFFTRPDKLFTRSDNPCFYVKPELKLLIFSQTFLTRSFTVQNVDLIEAHCLEYVKYSFVSHLSGKMQ